MTKHYFKYSSGYINVDETNLYLTNSGNWQEARELEEKGPATLEANDRRISRQKGFVITVLGAIGIAIFQLVSNKAYAISAIMFLLLLGLKVFEYFKRDFGYRYKIPLNKLIALERKGLNNLTIHFYNALGNPDKEEIKDVELKGIAFLAGLSLPKTA